MIFSVLIAVVLTFFALIYLWESGLFKKTHKVEATVVDETEDEVYDNTGNTKTRFFKVYEYFDGNENCIAKSERPMKKIDGDVNRKCYIYVDTKNRKAMEKRDIILYRGIAVVLLLVAVFLLVQWI